MERRPGLAQTSLEERRQAAGKLLRDTALSLDQREELLATVVWGQEAGVVCAALVALDGQPARRLAS